MFVTQQLCPGVLTSQPSLSVKTPTAQCSLNVFRNAGLMLVCQSYAGYLSRTITVSGGVHDG